MKQRFIDFLCCPMCEGELALTELRAEAEIEDERLYLVQGDISHPPARRRAGGSAAGAS